MVFYIIGNGFDRHHNMPTAYSHYREYLINHFPELKTKFETCKYINLSSNDDLWSDVEKSLELSCEDYYEENSDLYPNLSDERTPGWDDMLLSTRNDFGFIESFTGSAFKEWISSVDMPSVPCIENIIRSSFFVNFNFTHTLEQTYNVDPHNIYHIHGDINSDKLIFGCPNNNGQSLSNNLNSYYSNDEWYSLVYEPAIKEMVRLCNCASKNCRSKYNELTQFIEKARKNEAINRVIVMGHSFDGVDVDYYKDVFIPMLHDSVWEFYAFGTNEMKYKEDERRICDFANDNQLHYEIKRW